MTLQACDPGQVSAPVVVLFHDGCGICQVISSTMAIAFAGAGRHFEAVNLAQERGRAGQAIALGVRRLPSLVIDGKVMRLEDHSPIEHYA